MVVGLVMCEKYRINVKNTTLISWGFHSAESLFVTWKGSPESSDCGGTIYSAARYIHARGPYPWMCNVKNLNRALKIAKKRQKPYVGLWAMEF